MTRPGYSLLVIAHVLVAVIAFGALGATGIFARRLRASAEPLADASCRRFFRPSFNVAPVALYLVPILGMALVVTGSRDVAKSAYPWIGLVIWGIAVALASAVIFPVERQIQQAFSTEAEPAIASGQLRALARRCERAVGATSVCFVAALVVMIAQP
jgi:hypothetical protein